MAIEKETECLAVQIMFNKMVGSFQAYFQSVEVIKDGGAVIAATPTGNTLSINTANPATGSVTEADTLELANAVNKIFGLLYADAIAPPAVPEVEPE